MSERITTKTAPRKKPLQIHDHGVDPLGHRSRRITAWGAFLPLTLVTLLLTGCVAGTHDEVSGVGMALEQDTIEAYDDCIREVGDEAYCASFLCSAPERPEPPTECWSFPSTAHPYDPRVYHFHDCGVSTPRRVDCGSGRSDVIWCPEGTYTSKEECEYWKGIIPDPGSPPEDSSSAMTP